MFLKAATGTETNMASTDLPETFEHTTGQDIFSHFERRGVNQPLGSHPFPYVPSISLPFRSVHFSPLTSSPIARPSTPHPFHPSLRCRPLKSSWASPGRN